MKTELMRELFEEWFKNQPLPTNGTVTPQGEVGYAQEALEWAFQAACNMFLPFVEILPDDAEPKKGDYVLLPDVLGFTVIDEVKNVAKNGNIQTVSYERYFEAGKQIIRLANGKYAIRESELMGVK